MAVPLQISFRGMDPSPAVEARLREKAAKLSRFHDRILGCRVVVESLARTQHKGKLYRVRVDLSVPGRELVVRNTGRRNHAHVDVYVALRDAFDAAERRLEDHARVARRDVKTHETPPHGRVVRLFREDGYGFIESSDGQEIYFHRNSVPNSGFESLEVGSNVRFAMAEKEGIKGPQASTVRPVGKHHLVG